MSISLRKQILDICSTISYKAFGFNTINLCLQDISLIRKKSSSQIYYKCPLPNLIYEEYRNDGFRYSDEGMTPKQIAEDVLVHFTQKRHIQMQSDEFGNLLAFVKNEYFQEKLSRIQKLNHLKCHKAEEYEVNLRQNIKFNSTINKNSKNNTKNQQQQNKQNHKKLIFFQIAVNPEQISLTETRFKLHALMIKKLQEQIFDNKCYIVHNYEQIMNFIQNQEEKQSQQIDIIHLCLRHNIIQKNIKKEQFLRQLDRKLNKKSKKSIKINNFYMKFGSVFPQESFNRNEFHRILNKNQQRQAKNLKQIILGTPQQIPINLLSNKFQKEFHSHIQKQIKQNRELLNDSQNRNEILMRLEQYFQNHQTTKLWYWNQAIRQQIEQCHINIQKTQKIKKYKIIQQSLNRLFIFEQL